MANIIRLVGIGVVASLALAGLVGHADAQAEPVPILVELFTSQGCSSCPPADAILEMVSKEQPVAGAYVVGMSEHVTYWDHQGWTDPFGSARFTERQNAYAFRFKLENIFTPQLVVDGTKQFVGSDVAALRKALTEAARTPKPPLRIAASFSDASTLAVSATGPGLDAGAAEDAQLSWAVTEDGLTVDVKRGENAKRTLRHAGVVRTLVTRKIDRSRAGESMSAVIPLRADWKRENLRLVAFVQSTKSMRVLSVGWTRLGETR